MTISDYQVNSVIKTYMKNMKSRTVYADKGPESIVEDRVLMSDEGVKKMLFERIGEKMTERLRKHDQEE
jgi:hypothetical protein